MKLPEVPIELAASKEETRYALRSVLKDVENKCLVATEGNLMVVVPFEPSGGEVTKTIPAEALAWARKLKRQKNHRFDEPVFIDREDNKIEARVGAAMKVFDRENGDFPSYRDVLPNIPVDQPPTISLNVELLLLLAKALGGNSKLHGGMCVAIWLQNNNAHKAMKVALINNRTATGVLMPVRWGE